MFHVKQNFKKISAVQAESKFSPLPDCIQIRIDARRQSFWKQAKADFQNLRAVPKPSARA
jgi:hypothetical protein